MVKKIRLLEVLTGTTVLVFRTRTTFQLGVLVVMISKSRLSIMLLVTIALPRKNIGISNRLLRPKPSVGIHVVFDQVANPVWLGALAIGIDWMNRVVLASLRFPEVTKISESSRC